MFGGAKSSTPSRAGSKATTAMSHALVFASSTIFATTVYSTNVTGTPAWLESARPSSTVVPVSKPVALSFAPMTGLPVNTATRSAPVDASSALAAAVRVGAAGMFVQLVIIAMRSAASVPASSDWVCVMRTDISSQRLLRDRFGAY